MQERLPLDIQSGSKTFSGPVTGPETVEVEFKPPFRSKPNVVLSVAYMDIDQDPTANFNVGVHADQISTKGFTMVFKRSGKVNSLTAYWLAHS